MIAPFVGATAEVFKTVVGETSCELGAPSVFRGDCTTQEVTLVLSLTGHVEGCVFYGLQTATARRIAAAMVGEPVPTLDRTAQTTLAELAHSIGARLETRLEQAGYRCSITPPTVIIGRLAIIAPLPISRLVVPLETSFGPVEIGLAIRTRERAKTRPDSADGPTPEGEVTRASAAGRA